MPDKIKRVGEISYTESLLLENACYIDVRSPAEYALDHIPGALSLPLFDDEERARIGDIYRHAGPGEANLAGLDIAAPKLPRLLRRLDALHREGRALVLYCWRGGLRSQTLAATAELLRIPCLRLAGGYREYRRRLVAKLDQPLTFPMIVLHSLTGCGKTAVLRLLKEQYGLQTIDLEGLANHRGSVFGHIGCAEQPTQKYFQSLLTRELARLSPAQALLTEGESRRIGRLLLHDTLYAAMEQGARVLLYDTLPNRARRLLREYDPASHQEHIVQALRSPSIMAKFSEARLHNLGQLLEQGGYEEAIEFLLQYYYDPLYHYPDAPAPGYALCVDSADEQKAAAEIAEFVRINYATE